MAHTHSVIDDDLHFIIDPSTRDIGNGSKKVKLIQYDHNSEQFTFEIPRFVEGHDMSLCNSIRVNYININKSTREQHPGVYEVSNIQAEEDNIIFSWLVSRNATQYVGPLNFLIKFMCFDEGGYITYEWHTDIFKNASVSTGMNNEESIEEVYPDILEKWKSDVLAEEASRIVAESERVTAESERVTAESERATAESERVTAESKRVTAESERVAAESERVAAESERVAAESERANTFAGYETEINQFKNEIVTGKDFATDNTRFAIGVAEQNLEVPSMEEFNQLKDEKLSEPAEGLAVGKYFRVAALDENGHAVLEAVDAKTVGVQDVQVAGASVVADGVASVPMAENAPAGTQAEYGLVALGDKLNYGLTLVHDNGHNADVLTLSTPSQITIDNRNKTDWLSVKYAPLMAVNLDYAVKAAMCDGNGAAWTADEQAAARKRMGIPGDYKLIEEIVTTEEINAIERSIEPDGTPYKFSAAFIKVHCPAADYQGTLNVRYHMNRSSIIAYITDMVNTGERFAISKALWGNGYFEAYGSKAASTGHSALLTLTGTTYSEYLTKQGNIDKITLNLQSSKNFPIGSQILIYGVRA